MGEKRQLRGVTFGRDEARHLIHAMYTNNLSRPWNNKLVSGMHNESGMQYNFYSKRVGHIIHDCDALKEKTPRHERDG